MEVLKQIKLLNSLGYGKKAIARELKISKNTVKTYLLTGDDSVDNNDLPDKQEVLFAFFPYCKEELGRKGVTRQILWGEYKTKHPDGYSYSQFCELLSQWLQNTDASMHIEQQSGDKMYVDFAGSHLSIVDTDTGEIIQTEIFVSVLGFSGLTYVRACLMS